MRKLIISIVCVIVGSAFWFVIGYEEGQKLRPVEQKTAPSKPSLSMWSSPEVIRPSPPHPQWVIIQYRTNLDTGEIKAHIIANGSPRGILEEAMATATK